MSLEDKITDAAEFVRKGNIASPTYKRLLDEIAQLLYRQYRREAIDDANEDVLLCQSSQPVLVYECILRDALARIPGHGFLRNEAEERVLRRSKEKP